MLTSLPCQQMSGRLQCPMRTGFCDTEASSYGLKELCPLPHPDWVDPVLQWCHPYWHDPVTWPYEVSPRLLPISERTPMYPSCSFTVRSDSLLILSLLKILHLSIAQRSCVSCPTISQFFKQHPNSVAQVLDTPACFPGCIHLCTCT